MIIEVQNSSFPSEVPTAGSSFITVENDQLKTKHSDGSIKVYSTGITPEEVRDIVGVMLTDTPTIDMTYDDANDTISAEVKSNSITNAMLAGNIDASKIDGGIVSNGEFNQLNGVTGNIQTQLDGKEPLGTANTLMTQHINAVDPHTQYTTTSEAAAAAPVQSVAGKTGVVTLTKSDVGLGNVDNTSDVNKPISSATQTALNTKLDSSQKGVANGVATLDSSVKVPLIQIPSGIDHGGLSGLSDDDHPQYLNETRADARYYTETESNIRFAPYEHSHLEATQTTAGFLSATDKTKLDNITNPTLLKTTTTLYSTSNTTYTNLTELSQSCVSDKTYRFEIWIAYNSAATTTGISLSMNTPSGTLACNISGLVAANGTNSAYHGYVGYSSQPVVLTGTPTTNYYHMAKFEGIFIANSSGNLYPQFRSEISGSQIKVIAGSLALYNSI